MTRNLFYIPLTALLFFAATADAQINIKTEYNALKLAQKILGQGVTIMNAQFKGDTVSAATFEANASTLHIKSGIALTSGRAKSIGTGSGQRGIDGDAQYGLPGDQQASYRAGTPGAADGDADLNNFLSGLFTPPDIPPTTEDATVLEFDFIPQGDSINVRFIFGSEEYPTFTCSRFNDVFAFLITGPGFAMPTNIAVVPGTTIPVTINSINDGIAGSAGDIINCTKMGTGSPFTQYYVPNNGGMILGYNGFTTVLTAKAKVQPCKVYHIKLAIADAGDDAYDSGVFIEEGSFSSRAEFSADLSGGWIDPADSSVVLVEACQDADLTLKRAPNNILPFTVNVTYGGAATPGVDFTAPPAQIDFAITDSVKVFHIAAIPDALSEGAEKIVMYLTTQQGCSLDVSDSIVMYIRDSLYVFRNIDTFVCSAYPTTLIAAEPIPNAVNTYAWNTGSVTRQISVSAPGQYSVKHHFLDRCFNIDSFNVVSGDPTLAITNINPVICPDKPVTLNVNSNADSLLWNTGATTASLPLPGGGLYWVRAKNENGCFLYDTIDVPERPAPLLELGPDTALCAYESVVLNAFFPGATYQWNTGVTSASITASVSGMYKVISNLNGCLAVDSVQISANRMPVANAGKDEEIWKNSSTRLKAVQDSNNLSYWWAPGLSLDDDRISNPLATPDITTDYILTVTSKDGCELTDTVKVRVLELLTIPTAFSPNGDNFNDTWRIGNLYQFPDVKLRVYDRYGQEVFSSKGYQHPWNGNLKDKQLPVGTYYYIIDIGKLYKPFTGWIYLLR